MSMQRVRAEQDEGVDVAVVGLPPHASPIEKVLKEQHVYSLKARTCERTLARCRHFGLAKTGVHEGSGCDVAGVAPVEFAMRTEALKGSQREMRIGVWWARGS
jgi:hypothetical protein